MSGFFFRLRDPGAQSIKGPSNHQILDGLPLQSGAFHGFGQALEWATLFSKRHRLRCCSAPHPADVAQTQQKGLVPDGTSFSAVVNIRVQDGDTVALGIFLQSFGVVETHGLLVEDGNEKLQRVVILEPGHMVSGCSECEGMGLWEHVVTVELLEYPLGGALRNSKLGGPVTEPLPVVIQHGFIVAFAKGPAELFGLKRRKASHIDCHLVHLVLEQNNAQGTLQRPLL